ncbi:MAG: serine--tRNA ligase [Rhodospirillales bacterium RIFCSPLOWO2_12_FULL_58_28]|nr:MAG: serine--tRNA ligase [Rhodospirillales bacterium RIFCSPLOWO2_02_FULL_58_16]OHC78018.1 MAG: serine--tRNA ligase [Rhodospirillales bacterium RIFCSPLOWO2_12_FULL_58_28]
MFDIKRIRDNPRAFDEGLSCRGLPAASSELLELDQRRRDALTRAQELQAMRNKAAKAIGVAKAKGEDATALIADVSRSKAEEAEAEGVAHVVSEELERALAGFPNLPAADVPDGKDDTQNREERRVGEPPSFAFPPKEHFDIGEALGLMDFEAAAKISGARFVVLQGALARMERALASFMLDLHTGEYGYVEVNPPVLVRDGALFGTGQLPKFSADLFRTEDGLWLIPTAEVSLTNLVAGDIIAESALPKRFTAMTPCFRSEAGKAGKDTRGMIRQHQFAKVELVSIVHPDRSASELERMTSCAEEVLKRLELPYRVMTLCAGDMGFSAQKTYDIEVWLPGAGRYREISSCSDCGEFQARRMKARFRPEGGGEIRFVHTLNGSGLAVGRTLVAVLENYQNEDGSVRIPAVLRPYMGGLEVISGG